MKKQKDETIQFVVVRKTQSWYDGACLHLRCTAGMGQTVVLPVPSKVFDALTVGEKVKVLLIPGDSQVIGYQSLQPPRLIPVRVGNT